MGKRYGFLKEIVLLCRQECESHGTRQTVWQRKVQPCQCWLYTLREAMIALKKRIIQGANPQTKNSSHLSQCCGGRHEGFSLMWALAIQCAISCGFRLLN